MLFSVVVLLMDVLLLVFFFFQAEDGIRDAQESRGLGDVYKRQEMKAIIKRQDDVRISSSTPLMPKDTTQSTTS